MMELQAFLQHGPGERHAHATAQVARQVDYLHRQALQDLHIVAGGILRRQHAGLGVLGSVCFSASLCHVACSRAVTRCESSKFANKGRWRDRSTPPVFTDA
jgi:hypothetical protein